MENSLVILVVDDEELIRMVVEDALANGGYEVVTTSTGEDAIKLLDSAEGRYRALVTDIDLGSGLNGWAVAHRAREIDHSFPIVYMSGKSAADWLARASPTASCWQSPLPLLNLLPPSHNCSQAPARRTFKATSVTVSGPVASWGFIRASMDR